MKILQCDCCDEDVELEDNDDRDEVLCVECGKALLGMLGDFVETEKERIQGA